MKHMFLAGALALAALGLCSVASGPAVAMDNYVEPVAQIDIARIKSVLKLTPEQQAHWPRVEAALRDLSRRSHPGSDGLARRPIRRVMTIAMDGAAVARLGAACRPLIRALDERQRQAVLALVQEMGLGPIVTALL